MIPDNSKSYTSLLKITFAIGTIAVLIALFGLFQGLSHGDPRPLYSWLIGFTISFSISIGMLFLTMIFNTFDAGWAVIIRRQTEHALAAFPFLALAILPLILIAWFSHTPGILWEWMDPSQILPGSEHPIADDPIYIGKSGFLNRPFFTLRIIAYFTIFLIFSYKLRSLSFKMDFDPNIKFVNKLKAYSAVGLPVIALTTTFTAFDLFMSLSYQWFSTIFGVWFFATSMRAGLAVLVIILAILSTKGYLKGIFSRGHLYLIGCMFLAFTVFWAYISFSQYFLTYNANIPEETFWYQIREDGLQDEKNSWWFLSLFSLILGYFIIPFIVLLFYKTKVILSRMVLISSWILVCFVTDIYFNILPVKLHADNAMGYIVEQFSINLWDIASIIGIASFCAFAFIRSISKAYPIPLHDPRIQESLHTHE